VLFVDLDLLDVLHGSEVHLTRVGWLTRSPGKGAKFAERCVRDEIDRFVHGGKYIRGDRLVASRKREKMQFNLRRRAGALALVLAISGPLATLAAGSSADLRAKLLAAYAGITSYKITVLGSVKSSGVYVAPNRYKMTTQFEGKTVKTIFIGGTYWIFANGRWEKQTSGNRLDYDISGLLRSIKASPPSALVKLPDVVRNGKRLGTFAYTFKSSGTQETCNYDPVTYLVVRCKAEELTILYSGYNDPTNVVPAPK
jgi:hypothetical protein